MFRLRRIGSAPALVRTSTAWSRGRAPAAIRAGDVRGDPVGFLGGRRERLVADGRRRAGRLGTLGPELLGDPGPDLEPIRIVEPDQPTAGVEDLGARPVVAPQHDQAGPAVALRNSRMLLIAAPRKR